MAGINKALKAKDYVEKIDSEKVQAMIYSTLTRDYVLLGNIEGAENYLIKLTDLPK